MFEHPELIETLWNVNIFSIIEPNSIMMELIETLWNVNISSCGMYEKGQEELIETLWNVNGVNHQKRTA